MSIRKVLTLLAGLFYLCGISCLHADKAVFSYSNGFEETDDMKPWIITPPYTSLKKAIKQGKVTLNAKELSGNISHSGQKSLKIDITFNENIKKGSCYFIIDFHPKPLIIKPSYVSGYLYIKESSGLKVDLAYSIFYQGTSKSEGGINGSGPCNVGFNENQNGWRYYQHDLYSTVKYVCKKGGGKSRGWKVDKNYIDGIGILIRGDFAPGKRVVVYIDDIYAGSNDKKINNKTRGSKSPAKPAGNEKLKVGAFYPLGERGLFLPGQEVEFRLLGRKEAGIAGKISVDISVEDFYGKPVAAGKDSFTVNSGAKAFSHDLKLKPPANRGFYLVKAIIRNGKRLVSVVSSTFCVVEKAENPDPFFGITANGFGQDVLKAIQLMGAKTRGLQFRKPLKSKTMKEYEQMVVSFLDKGKTRKAASSCYWEPELDIVVSFPVSHLYRYYIAQEKKNGKGKARYPDDFYEDFGNFVEAVAKTVKGRVKTWVIPHEEFDLTGRHDPVELERFIKMTREGYKRVKKIDPESVVGGLTVSGVDCMAKPRFPRMKMVLPRLTGYFDVLAPDAYTGAHRLGRPGGVLGPEKGKLRSILLEARDLQRQYGKGDRLFIPERGVAVPYHLPFDHPLNKRMTNLTARALIISKSVPGVFCYMLFMDVGWAWAHLDRGRNISDFGLWKVTMDEQQRKYYHPRSAVAAYSTVAGLLSNTSEPVEMNIQKGFYCYIFKKNGNSVAALWTTDEKPYEISLRIPAKTSCYNLMGEKTILADGMCKLKISASPLFLVSGQPQKTLADAIKTIKFPSLPLVKCEARPANLSTLTFYVVNQTNRPQKALIELISADQSKAPEQSKEVLVSGNKRIAVNFKLADKDISSLKKEKLSGRVKVNNQSHDVPVSFDLIPVKKADRKIIIDGDLSEYNGSDAVVLDELDNLFPTADIFANKLWTGKDDLSAEFYLRWDDDYFYMAVSVTDDIFIQNKTAGSIWKNDCVEFAFDTMNDALKRETCGEIGYDGNDYDFGMALTPEGPQSYCWTDKGVTGGPRKFPLAVKRVGNKINYELAIPWKSLSPLKAEAGKAFGLNFVVFDIDREKGNAAYWLGLTPGIAPGKDPSEFKTFYLAP
jgi:hypothetical protein